MYIELHVAGIIADGRERIGGSIIHQPVTGGFGELGGLGLRGGDGTECWEHEGVDADSIVKESTDLLLDGSDVRSG